MNIIAVYKKFPSQSDCLSYLEQVKWDNIPKCPYCKSTKQSPLKKEHRYHCNNCNTSFSVTVGTIFHKTKVDLQKWFFAISMMLNAKKGVSARQLARDLEINKNTAWYMAMRIRRAMSESLELLEGIVEIDETYIGGSGRKKKKTWFKKVGRGTDKTPIIGMVERGGKIIAKPVKNTTSKLIRSLVRKNINTETATIMTDQYRSYCSLSKFTDHQTINHRKWYVDGDIHTNSIESFWALLKRGIVGQYHKVSLAYLPQYINEFCYRHNNRKETDIFDKTVARALEVTH